MCHFGVAPFEVFHVDAWDMNCPKHIPVLLPAAAVERTVGELQARIAELESQLAAKG